MENKYDPKIEVAEDKTCSIIYGHDINLNVQEKITGLTPEQAVGLKKALIVAYESGMSMKWCELSSKIDLALGRRPRGY